MESLVESSDVYLHDREGEESSQDAPDSIEEWKTDDIRYHGIVVLKGTSLFFCNTGMVER